MTLMFIQFWRPTQQYLYKISKGYLSYATMRDIFKTKYFNVKILATWHLLIASEIPLYLSGRYGSYTYVVGALEKYTQVVLKVSR